MAILTKITDLLYRRQKTIEIIAIFLFFSLVAFRFDSKKVKLFWSDYPSVAILLALTTALIAVSWLRIEKQKTQLLISNLQKENTEKSTKIESKLFKLSLRQKAVFDLILKGKSNKEITAELNIELSTLKTHINQIYKILGIKSRSETKNFKNEIVTGT
jgi:DNA-binding CsgD family transcriptional regulator